jgi:LPXTG-motif cell wall-anchored protein
VKRKKFAALAALVAAGVAVALVALSQSASANGHPKWRPTIEKCNPGWYVNPDEQNLRPQQTRYGLLFDGPSLIHHTPPTPLKLSDLKPGSFDVHVFHGVAPLFKVETDTPYSTLNYVGDGTSNLWWSSKIAAGQDGGQGKPQEPSWFVGQWNYTAATTILSYGVGYAKDAGNKALVKSVTFAGVTDKLSCAPPPPPTTTTTTDVPTSSTTTTTDAPPSSSSSSSTSTGTSSNSSTTSTGSARFTDCAEVRAAGLAPLYLSDTDYRTDLDSDGDGVACETEATHVGAVGEKGLAYTGTSDKLPIILWIGILAVLLGVVLIFVYRRRSSRSGDHRS